MPTILKSSEGARRRGGPEAATCSAHHSGHRRLRVLWRSRSKRERCGAARPRRRKVGEGRIWAPGASQRNAWRCPRSERGPVAARPRREMNVANLHECTQAVGRDHPSGKTDERTSASPPADRKRRLSARPTGGSSRKSTGARRLGNRRGSTWECRGPISFVQTVPIARSWRRSGRERPPPVAPQPSGQLWSSSLPNSCAPQDQSQDLTSGPRALPRAGTSRPGSRRSRAPPTSASRTPGVHARSGSYRRRGRRPPASGP
jgi:hypothetical protein